MLEQQRVAAQRRIEYADVKDPLERQQQQRHRKNRGRQHKEDAGGIERPQEHRHPVPGHPRRAQAMDGDNEIQPGRDGGKARDEDASYSRHHMAFGVGRGQGV